MSAPYRTVEMIQPDPIVYKNDIVLLLDIEFLKNVLIFGYSENCTNRCLVAFCTRWLALGVPVPCKYKFGMIKQLIRRKLSFFIM